MSPERSTSGRLTTLVMRDVSPTSRPLPRQRSRFLCTIQVYPWPAILVTMRRNLVVEPVHSSLVIRHVQQPMRKLIDCARVCSRQQSTGQRQADRLVASVRQDELFADHGVSGARSTRPGLDRTLDALIRGDTLVIMALDRLGRFTQNMLAFAQ